MNNSFRLVFGLGNPGPVYENTRHNLGAKAVLYFASVAGLTLKVNKKLGCALSVFEHENGPIIIARSLGFMNLSGQVFKQLIREYCLSLNAIVVVHDDVRLKLGQGVWQDGGPQRGQNGLRSIVQEMGTEDFSRLRLGIANEQCDPTRADFQHKMAGFVLSAFSSKEAASVTAVLQHASAQILAWANHDLKANFYLPECPS